jgi:hypothetical protein
MEEPEARNKMGFVFDRAKVHLFDAEGEKVF